eukprot:SAG25_NODE_338_length_9538_cov_22.622630_10_plen_93_part_00
MTSLFHANSIYFVRRAPILVSHTAQRDVCDIIDICAHLAGALIGTPTYLSSFLETRSKCNERSMPRVRRRAEGCTSATHGWLRGTLVRGSAV